MKKENIIFKWKSKDIILSRELDRHSIYEIFSGIAKGFKGDNEISLKLLEIIPTVDEIYIDEDFNFNQDVPGIIITEDNDSKLIKIIRYHKIVWSILRKFENQVN